mmetsp:Transcript_67328/g.161417  ORF Transcript_67328/g.161417 Transcript_67328/m.161417 type:complete len:381 (-) Transcript_67328:102-1244(-)
MWRSGLVLILLAVLPCAARAASSDDSARIKELEDELRKEKLELKAFSPIYDAVEWLETSDYQLAIATFGLVLGLASIWRPVRFLQGCACCLAALAAGLVAWEIASQVWDGEFQELIAAVAGLEAGVVAAVAVAYGFEGAQLMIGALLGLGVAHATLSYAPVIDSAFPVSFAWNSVFALVGFAVMWVGKRNALGLLGPLLGGLLVADSTGYLLTVLISHGGDMAPYVEFLPSLILGQLSSQLLTSTELEVVRSISVLLWIVVTLLGIRVYLNGSIFGSPSDDEEVNVVARPTKRVTLDLPPARQPLLEEAGSGTGSREANVYRYHPRDSRGPKRGFTMPQFMRGSSKEQVDQERPSVPKMPKVPKRLGSRSKGSDPYDFYG